MYYVPVLRREMSELFMDLDPLYFSIDYKVNFTYRYKQTLQEFNLTVKRAIEI